MALSLIEVPPLHKSCFPQTPLPKWPSISQPKAGNPNGRSPQHGAHERYGGAFAQQATADLIGCAD